MTRSTDATDFDASGAAIVTNRGTYTNFERFDFFGGSANDRFIAGGLVDILRGGDGNDELHGGGGNDYLDGGQGADRVYGGDGDDYVVLTGLETGEVLDGGAGTDSLYLDLQTATGPSTFDLSTIFGGGTAVVGGVTFRSFERFAGFGGSDYADTLILGPGVSDQTSIRAGGGNDSITGGSGVDELHGDDGSDTLNGGAGNDRLFGGRDNDLMRGGADDDFLRGDDGDDELHGDDGNDVLIGERGNDEIHGGSGDDELEGGAGSDLLEGGDGNDALRVGLDHFDLFDGIGFDGPGAGIIDTANGGAGDDVITSRGG